MGQSGIGPSISAQRRSPLRLRLIRVRTTQTSVWLLTDLLEPALLSRARAAKVDQWRWRIEGMFRTCQPTLPKVKVQTEVITVVTMGLQ